MQAHQTWLRFNELVDMPEVVASVDRLLSEATLATRF
jgi:hypothetical protein